MIKFSGHDPIRSERLSSAISELETTVDAWADRNKDWDARRYATVKQLVGDIRASLATSRLDGNSFNGSTIVELDRLDSEVSQKDVNQKIDVILKIFLEEQS